MSGRLDRRGFLGAALALLAGPAWGRWGPRAIVTAGGDITEIVVALAGLEAVEAVDTTSRTPPQVRSLPSIGYLRQVSVEGILSLDPDLVIANADLGPPAAVDQVRSAGVRVELVEAPPSAEGLAAKIARVGMILGREEQARTLASASMKPFEALAKRLAGIADRPRIAFVRSATGGNLILAGRITSIDAAFALAGGVNGFDFPSFRTVSREVLASAPPAFLAVPGEVLEKAGEKRRSWLRRDLSGRVSRSSTSRRRPCSPSGRPHLPRSRGSPGACIRSGERGWRRDLGPRGCRPAGCAR